MDPASAIGIAAAAFQFAQLTAKATAKGVGLLRSLKETPSKLKELLSVVEISNKQTASLQESLSDPASTLAAALPHDQLSFLRTNVDEAARITRELQKELESLFGSQKRGLTGAKKLWRDVLSVKRERALEEKLNKMKWYNGEIERGLQVSVLALAGQILECSNTTQASVDDNTAQLRELNVMMTDLNGKVNDMVNSPMAVQARFDGLAASEIQATQFSSTTAHLAISVRQEPGAATKEDLNEIRKDLLMLMTGQKSRPDTLSNAPSSTGALLSDSDKVELAAQIRQELLNPSTLKSSCDFLMATGIQPEKLPLPLRTLSAAHRSISRDKLCRCQIATYDKPEKTLKHGPFSFYYRGEKQHDESCPHRKTQARDRSWRYQLGMQLAPLLNKTVQFAFSASFGGGGLELQFPMRVFPTVQRSKSPIFKLFDSFPERCTKTIRWQSYEEKHVYLHWKMEGKCFAHGGEVNQFIWDVDLVRAELRHIHKALLDSETFQIGSIRDRDESGYTVLHEIAMLVLMLAPVYSQIVLKRDLRQLQRLLALLSPSQLEVQAFGFHGLSVLDLAVGWPEGLQVLSVRWPWDVSRTLWLAHLLSDNDSLWILSYMFPCMPMNSFVFVGIIQSLSKTGAMDHAKIIIQAQIQKRKELADLGRQHLSAEEQEGCGLDSPDGTALDCLAWVVYDKLKTKKAIPLHRIASLNPGIPNLSIYTILSILLTDIYMYRPPAPFLTDVQQLDCAIFLVDVLEELWKNGFRTIDQEGWYTPVEGLLFALSKDLDRLPLIVWLLQHGAKPNFLSLHLPTAPCRQTYIPNNLLWRLGQVSRKSDHPLRAELLFDLVRYAAGVCNTMETDSCVCYCSSSGCLPLHDFVMFDRPWNEDCFGREHEMNMVMSFIEACSLTDDEKTRCFAEAVRMELFFRLGLVHSCHGNWRLTTEERGLVREEYEELGSQLNLLITAYRGSLMAFSLEDEKPFSIEFICDCMEVKGYGPVSWGSHNLDRHTTRLLAHWQHWWSLMAKILTDPNSIPLDHDERITKGDTRFAKADTMTALALKQQGYEGLDYTEVIQRHFAHELQSSAGSIELNIPDQVADNNGSVEKPVVRLERPELLEGLMEKLQRKAAGLEVDSTLKKQGENHDTKRPKKKKKRKHECQCPGIWMQTQSRCHHSWDFKTHTPRSSQAKKDDSPSVTVAVSFDRSQAGGKPPDCILVEI
ncbi:hypothetical protein B0T20DRAFT_364503 [Sordaria brevicollis]|uniref:Fungal N-terminal domain-containing protein n=1 Tax=Sordaria brevicollis TaxID=83679 RepID=A0AAE0NVJ2_SORBR|nr:hypothetical protein B0T20DRAFT_364503 [Sordaria brevicollis]